MTLSLYSAYKQHWPHPPTLTFHMCLSENWYFFLGLQLHPLQCVGGKYAQLAPQHPNLTLTAHPISKGNKAKQFRQIWNKHIQTLCLSHLGTTNGFSSYSRLKIYAYLRWNPSLSKHRSHSANHEVSLHLPPVSSLSHSTPSSFWWQRQRAVMFPRHLSRVARCCLLEVAHTPFAYFTSTPHSSL